MSNANPLSPALQASDQAKSSVGCWRIGLLFVTVLAIAALLRLVDLGGRPFHADEAVQADIFANLLEAGIYTYDPRHYHGPLPHFLNLGIAALLGVERLDTLQAWQFRLLPALSGLGVVALVWIIAGRKNTGPAAWAAALAAASPIGVFFSRIAIHEMTLAFLSLALAWTGERAWRTQRWPWWIATGVVGGLLVATKETWIIVLFSFAAALLMLGGKETLRAAFKPAFIFRSLIALGTALSVASLLYTNLGRNPVGIVDAGRTFFEYRTGAGHDRPWFHYLAEVFGGSYSREAVGAEGLVAALAMIAFVLAVRAKRRSGVALPGLPALLGLAGLVQITVYSLLSYKTPWLMLCPTVFLLPAAGWAAHELACAGGGLRRAATVSGLVLAWLLASAIPATRVNVTGHAYSKSPYAYASTRPEADPAMAGMLAGLPSDALVAVIGDDYWPLPWYLRDRRASTGYFAREPENFGAFALRLYCGRAFAEAPAATAETVFALRDGYYVKAVRLDGAR